MQNENPSFAPAGKSTAEPRRFDGGIHAKGAALRSGYAAQNAQSHPANPANRGDVVTPTPRPAANPQVSAYYNAPNAPKQKPVSPREYPQ